MAYCGPRGIPLSAFLGWDQDDQDAALAWQALEAEKCPGCGTRHEEWDESQGGSRHAWLYETYVCSGCEQLQRVSEEASQAEGRGVRVRRVVHPSRVAG